MSDPLGLSIGTTNLVAARVGSAPLMRPSALALSTQPPVVMSGFVERVGDPVPLVAADGSAHVADQLLVQALEVMVDAASGAAPPSEVVIAVPAHWGSSTLRALRTALRTNAGLSVDGAPARLVSDAVASLTALNANPGLGARGVVALLDFGGRGTSITLVDAGLSFEPIDETLRYQEFSGDRIDQALLAHVLDGIAGSGDADAASTAAVGSLTRLRDECRHAKERLSTSTTTELTAELPGYRCEFQLNRAELDALISEPLAGVIAALEDMLVRNMIAWGDLAAVAIVGGCASIPLVAQRLLSRTPVIRVVTTPQSAFNAAIGAALLAAYGPEAEAPTGVAPTAAMPDSSVGESGSATLHALAWSQADDGDADPVPYTGQDLYEIDPTGGRPPVEYIPETRPVERGRSWYRLPQLLVGGAAAVALVAVGGVAFTLTGLAESSSATESSNVKTMPQTTHVDPPSPSVAAPVQTVTAAGPAAPPPPATEPPTTTGPPATTTATPTTTQTTTPTTTTTTPTTTTTTTTTTTPTTTTTTPTTTTTTSTTTTTTPTTTTTTTTIPPMRTTQISIPFLPVPIPIQVPQSQSP